MKGKWIMITGLILLLMAVTSGIVVVASNFQSDKNTILESSLSLTTNNIDVNQNTMVQIMLDNGFEEMAQYMLDNNVDAMSQLMLNMTKEDYNKMIDLMRINDYGDISTIGIDEMNDMHNSMENSHCGTENNNMN